MRAFQSEFFRKLPPHVRRAALESAIAAQDPESGFERQFEYNGKVYKTISVREARNAPNIESEVKHQ